MRVISGSARGLKLKAPKGMHTRPTTDKIKETIFNILAPEIYDCRFLDIFSGSGATAIEALSRGAEEAVLIENDREALGVIRDNLKSARVSHLAEVLGDDFNSALNRLGRQNRRFDLVFMDPPYHQGLERQVLEYLQGSSVIDKDTLIIVEADLHTDFSYVESLGYELLRSKEYKTNKHVFLKKLP